MIVVRGLAVPYDEAGFMEGTGFLTQFVRGAFNEALAEKRVDLRLNHGHVALQAASVVVHDAPRGLFFAAAVERTHTIEALREFARAGLIRGASVGVVRQAEYWRDSVRVIERAVLREISLIITPKRPAFDRTWVEVKEE